MRTTLTQCRKAGLTWVNLSPSAPTGPPATKKTTSPSSTQALLPPDIVHWVPAKGTAVPTALVEHPDVHKISFTGSPGAGIAVSKAEAVTFTNFSFELGGKNALVIFEDANLDRAVADALVVHENIHDEFVERVSKAYRKVISGDGTKKATRVGPQVSKVQQENILQYIELGKKEGATVAAEGSLPTNPNLKNGFFVKPTLFTNVSSTIRIAQEEIFGPVQVVIKFFTYDEAISIANGTDFSLVAGIYTNDPSLQWKAARDVEVGMVLINNYLCALLGTPFGGVKGSGQAREHCEEEVVRI